MRPGRALIFQFDPSVSQASNSPLSGHPLQICWCSSLLGATSPHTVLLAHLHQLPSGPPEVCRRWLSAVPQPSVVSFHASPPYGWINFSSAARSSTDCYSRVNDCLCSQFCLLYICLLPTVMPTGSCTSLPPAARGFADPAVTLSASSSADGGSPPVGAILCRRRCSSLSPSQLFPTRYTVCHMFRRCIMTALFSPSSSPSFSHMKTEPPLPLLLVSS